MTTTQPGSFMLDLLEALNISMSKADEALDAGDHEAHQKWSAWSDTLLAEIKRLQRGGRR